MADTDPQFCPIELDTAAAAAAADSVETAFYAVVAVVAAVAGSAAADVAASAALGLSFAAAHPLADSEAGIYNITNPHSELENEQTSESRYRFSEFFRFVYTYLDLKLQDSESAVVVAAVTGSAAASALASPVLDLSVAAAPPDQAAAARLAAELDSHLGALLT